MRIFILFIIIQCSQDPIEFDKGVRSVRTGWENEKYKLSSEYCKNCHLSSHNHWKDSSHAKSWKNPLFQRSYSLEPSPWCINCHAPLYIQKEEIYEMKNTNFGNSYLADEGINCAVCHVRGGKIYGHRMNINPSHEVVMAKNLSSPEYCAGCHEFHFPITKNGKFIFSEEIMQGTYSEWKDSGQKKTCIQCHWKDHELNGPHTPEFLKKMISDIQVEFIDSSLLRISFSILRKRAHNFPSGDLFRSLVLEVSGDSNFKNMIFSRKFARFFGMGKADTDSIWNRTLVSNSTIPFNQDEISTTIDIPSQKILYVRIMYYFHDPELGGEISIEESKLELKSIQIIQNK